MCNKLPMSVHGVRNRDGHEECGTLLGHVPVEEKLQGGCGGLSRVRGMFRVGHNYICPVYTRYFWQENHQIMSSVYTVFLAGKPPNIYGYIRCITVYIYDSGQA